MGFARETGLRKFPGGFRPERHDIFDQTEPEGLTCANPNCIVHDAMEGKYARNRFELAAPQRLRCFYCETDIAEFVVGNRKTRHFSADVSIPRDYVRNGRDIVLFADADAAMSAGYSQVKRRRKAAHA